MKINIFDILALVSFVFFVLTIVKGYKFLNDPVIISQINHWIIMFSIFVVGSVLLDKINKLGL